MVNEIFKYIDFQQFKKLIQKIKIENELKLSLFTHLSRLTFVP